jgi:predicted DCC family thiol-disulfide oxidoreductase YuxK
VRSEPVTPSPTCTVYFDGACPVCRREIAHYRRLRGSNAIAWVDASSCDDAALGPGLDRSLVLSRFHVREEDGTLTSGAAAFVAIWRRLPAFAWISALASCRPVLALLDAGYAIFLAVRPWWRPADPRLEAAGPGSSIRRADRASGQGGPQAPSVVGGAPTTEQLR